MGLFGFLHSRTPHRGPIQDSSVSHLSIITFCYYYYHSLFSLSIISYLIFQLQLGLCFFLCLISKFCSCTCGFREQVEKGFNGFSSIFCLLLYLSLKNVGFIFFFLALYFRVVAKDSILESEVKRVLNFCHYM